MKIQSSSELYFLTTFFHWFDDRDVAASLHLLFRISTYIGIKYYGGLFGISQFLKDFDLQIDLDKAWTSSSFFKCQLDSKIVMHVHFHEKLTLNSFVKVKSMLQHAVRKITTSLEPYIIHTYVPNISWAASRRGKCKEHIFYHQLLLLLLHHINDLLQNTCNLLLFD